MKNIQGRSQKTLRNLRANIFNYILKMLLPIVNRTIFINIFGEMYLGLNSSFTSIMSLLSLTELGVSTAIGFQLYECLVNDDKVKISALINEIKKVYRTISIIIFFIGVVLLPFIRLIIKEDIPNLEVAFIIYILSSVSTYLFSYNHVLLDSDQNSYIKIYIFSIALFIKNILQIVIILITKNYLLYLVIMLLTTLVENVYITLITNKSYSYLKENKNEKLDTESKKTLYTNVKALFKNRVGMNLLGVSDSIIIMLIKGLSAAGIYSNYVYIINIFSSFISTTSSSLGASVGNLIAEKNEKLKYDMLFNIKFIFFIFTGYIVCQLIALLNPFIYLWIGNKYTTDYLLVILLLINFYITTMRQPIVMFKDAFGLFYYDRNRTLITACVNIPLSLVLAMKLGMIGVVLGTTISMLSITSWYEPWVLFRKGYKKKYSIYVKEDLKQVTFVICISFILFIFSNLLLKKITILRWIFVAIINTIIYFLAIILIYRNKNEFNYFKNFINNIETYLKLPAVKTL